MKIINLTEFRKLPEGTIFAKYHHSFSEELQRKGKSCGISDDFLCSDFSRIECVDPSQLDDRLEEMEHSGAQYPLEVMVEVMEGFDGLFEKDQLFMIYDSNDIRLIIDELSTLLK